MACGSQENGFDAYPVGTHRQKEIPILLILTLEEALVPQPVPQKAAVGISGTGGSEQPLKELPILLLHPCLPAASLPTATLYAVQTASHQDCHSWRPGLYRSPAKSSLLLLAHCFAANRTEGRTVRGSLCSST